MATHIASAFDKNYLVRAIAFYRSVEKLMPSAYFWLLCLDAESKSAIDRFKLKNVESILIEDMRDDELLSVRPTRNSIEFAMTSKPAFLAHLVNSGKIKDGETLTLSDVDILFFASPAARIDELMRSGNSIFITPHKFPKRKEKKAELVGFYNSGFIIFRIDDTSRRCLNDWRKDCIEWCSLTHDFKNKRHTDQLYLDRWKERYAGVFDLPDKGLNPGSWNIESFSISKDERGSYLIDGEMLINYHYHGLKVYLDRKERVRAYPISVSHEDICDSCIAALQKAFGEIRSMNADWHYGFAPALSLFRYLRQKAKKLIS